VESVLPILLLGLAGLLVGGTISLYRQRSPRIVVALVGLLAGLSAAGGVLWMVR
jgi:hypothetical protein